MELKWQVDISIYPALFLAGPDGRILYTDVSADPDCFPNMERLLEVVDYGPTGWPDES